LLLFFWVITWNEAAVNEVTLHLLVPFSLFDRFYPFALGAIDTRDVTYLVLFTVAFLTFPFFALDSRRWRGLRRCPSRVRPGACRSPPQTSAPFCLAWERPRRPGTARTA